jgi:hypothetical protein
MGLFQNLAAHQQHMNDRRMMLLLLHALHGYPECMIVQLHHSRPPREMFCTIFMGPLPSAIPAAATTAMPMPQAKKGPSALRNSTLGHLVAAAAAAAVTAGTAARCKSMLADFCATGLLFWVS